jgi:hypothetical protein
VLGIAFSHRSADRSVERAAGRVRKRGDQAFKAQSPASGKLAGDASLSA